MKPDALGLQAFVAIAEYGAFHKAANALSITQAGLSRRLKNLESQLGVVLIERTTRSWRLSPVGAGFLPRAQRLVTDLNNAFHEIRDASRLDNTEVSIACVSSVAYHLLPEIVLRYSKRYPRNRVRIFDAAAHEVTDAVISSRYEIGITVAAGVQRGVDAIALLRDPFVLMCRDDHRLAGRKEIHWRDLRNEALILINHSTASGLLFKQSLSNLKVVPPRLFEVQHPNAALGLVGAGVGAAILPQLILARDTYPRIRRIRLVGPLVRREIALIHPHNAELTQGAKNLSAIVREVFTEWSRKKRGR